MSEKVTISVHERLDEPGFVVKITSSDTTRRYVTDSFEEAHALANAIRGFLEAGFPAKSLDGDGGGSDQEHVQVSDACPRCGCGEVDDFTWDGQGEQVMCDRCGKCYVPRGSTLVEEDRP